ncbi:MAG: HAMP domain-containing sensor histidine kinase [Helicobacteraceae bacterium]|nr:HAMP domain-containing sensor histidine kinase [Helicobacteraceae bacterium]
MDCERQTALKILSLYVITSFLFLSFVFYSWYQKEKDSILKQEARILRDEVHILVENIHEQRKDSIDFMDFNAVFNEAANGLKIPFMVVRGDGKVLFDSLESLSDAQVAKMLKAESKYKFYDIRHYDRLVVDDDKIYLISQRFKGRFWRELLLENDAFSGDVFLIREGQLGDELIKLKMLVLGCLILSLLAMSAIAYFLVSLSLRPLRERINKLNAFIKDSTHEINTPLSVILMSIERFKTDDLKEAELQKFARIKQAAKTLEQIYQDLLFYTFDEAKDLRLEKVAMGQLVSERISYFEPNFLKKNIALSFKLKLKKSSECIMEANYSRIVRVVDNLLDNALKYTDNGGSVEIVLGENYLQISDTGCGISKDAMPKIFDRYFRANSQQGGFGIGLALVKSICDLYKIKITCKSKECKGTSFMLEW